MAVYTVSPDGKQYFWDNLTGAPLSGGLIYTVASGGAWPGGAIATYTDVGGLVPNTNPIVLNSSGYCTIRLAPGVSYKYIVRNSAGVLQWTEDGISAVPGSATNIDVTGTAGEAIAAGKPVYLSAGDGGKTAGSWYVADSTNAYSSTSNWVGMAPAAIASGASGAIRLDGKVSDLTGLTAGTHYYIGIAGAITSSAPANTRKLGQADTTTSLILTGNPLSPTDATLPFSDITTNDVSTTKHGFVPKAPNDVTKALSGLGTWTNFLSGKAYTPTVAPVDTTSTITTFLSFTVSATDEVATLDVVEIDMPALLKNFKGTSGTVTFTFSWAATTAASSAITWNSVNAEYSVIFQFRMQRVGADLWIRSNWSSVDPTVDDSEIYVNNLTQCGSNVLKISAPSFTGSQAVLLRATLSAADAAFYLKPQGANVRMFKKGV